MGNNPSSKINTVIYRRGIVRHLTLSNLRDDNSLETLCGRNAIRGKAVVLDGIGDRKHLGYPLCKQCAMVRRLADFDVVTPELDELAVRRAVAMDAATVEITGRIFRVEGSTDTYTVTWPDDTHLASLCNCMAGKVHPEKMCKHQVTVQTLIEKSIARYTTLKRSTTLSEATT